MSNWTGDADHNLQAVSAADNARWADAWHHLSIEDTDNDVAEEGANFEEAVGGFDQQAAD